MLLRITGLLLLNEGVEVNVNFGMDREGVAEVASTVGNAEGTIDGSTDGKEVGLTIGDLVVDTAKYKHVVSKSAENEINK